MKTKMAKMKKPSTFILALLSAIVLNPCLETDAQLTPLKEINYYPQNHAWTGLWEHWLYAKPEMDADLDKIADLGANTVRIFLHQNIEYRLAEFDDGLDLIDAHGLKAHVTLFDCWEPWQLGIAENQALIDQIVLPFQNDGRIAVWELKNEVDLGNPVIRDWTEAMFPYLKQQAGNTPCTVSVNNADHLAVIRDITTGSPPDIYSYHWYPEMEPFPLALAKARQTVGDAELLIGEFGCSTHTYSDTFQSNLYTDVLHYANTENIAHLGAWTLNDFPEGTLVCLNSATPDSELHFGLIRTDGTTKPAHGILKSAFTGDPPARPSPFAVLSASFENDVPLPKDYWKSWDESWSGQERFAIDCSTSRCGECSVRLFSDTSGLEIGIYALPAFLVESGKRYSLSAYARTQNLDGEAKLVFSWFDENGWMANTDSAPLTAENLSSWTRISVCGVTPPAGTVFFQVFAKMRSNGTSASVWFDDVTAGPDGPAPLEFAITLMKVVTGLAPDLQCVSRPDVDCNGQVGLAEVIHTLQKTAGIR